MTFRESQERNFDDRLSNFMNTLVGITTNDTEGGVTSLYRPMSDPRFEEAYSGWYWQISVRGQTDFRSPSLWDESLEIDFDRDVAAGHIYETTGPEGQRLRVIERDITIPGNETLYRYSVAIDMAEIDEQAAQFNNILVISLGILGVGLIFASVVQVFLGLRPLRQIRISLGRVRSAEEKHLPMDFPAEIQPLADELNALLDHNNEVIERSRTQVGNLAHALKTPLAVLLNEASLKNDAVLKKQVELMHRQVDHYLKRARLAANRRVISSRTQIAGPLRDICRTLGKIYRDKNLDVDFDGPEEDFAFRGEEQDFEEMVGNLLENAVKWARCDVHVQCCRKNGMLHISVSDDGPGIDKAARDGVFARGERLDETVPGSGLGLSIVQELVHLYGGEILLEDNEKGGLRAVLIIPALS